MKLQLFIQLFAVMFLLGCLSGNKSSSDEQMADKPEPKSQASQGPVLGLDVSHFQGSVNWEQVKADKIRYAYAKATQGETYQDPDYDRNISDANAAGIPIGSYHFYVAADDAEKQVEMFVRAVKKVDNGDMPPVLDLEQGGVKGTINKDQFQKSVLQWLEQVESKLGVNPIVYTNNPFANEYLTDSKFADYQLWIAEYTSAKEPRVPEIWKDKGWLMWQRSEKGAYKGVAGQNVDHDIFNGTEEDLKKLLKR